MLTVIDHATYLEAMEFINGHEILAYDTETTGLNTRRDKVIGFGVSSGLDGFYVPIYAWDSSRNELLPIGVGIDLCKNLIQALLSRKLITWNASFDMRMTKYNFGIDLLPALHADVLLLKHTCDEDFPFGLKEVATKLWGTNVTEEKEAMQASIKAAGGTAKEYFKADMQLLGKYCVQDCLLTYRLYNYYSKALKDQNLEKFYYEEEVLPLYKEVTIPMEERGVQLDIPKMVICLSDITNDLLSLEDIIMDEITPNLDIFTTWFLNKDYPVQTRTGKQPAWAKKGLTQHEAWRKDNPIGYMFNLLSKHHLKKLFFDTLKCEPLSRTPTGLPQVDEEFMHSVQEQLPWVTQLIEYNKLTKLKSTYIERFLDEQEEGRFYPSFMQHRTVSGRYAGDLQQLPRPVDSNTLSSKYTNLIREFFIPDLGGKLVSADYEQLEPSIFAHTSGDLALQEIFNKGADFYSEVAIRTERINASSDKNNENYLGKTNKAARQKAKAYALGIAYGMTGYKLQFEIGVSHEAAEDLVRAYLRAFPDLARWMEQSKDEVRYHGKISSQAGRVRHMPRAASLFVKYGARLGDSLQLWKDYNADLPRYIQAKTDRKEYINLCNNAINFQVQSLAASIVNRASISIARKLKTEGLKAAICMQVHDELVLNVPEAELNQVCIVLKHEMETIVKLAVPLRTTPQVGSNFRDCK